MEAHPATTQDIHPTLGKLISTPGSQVPNDRTQRDRTRKRRSKPCRKRLKVLDNPEELAFRAWTDVPEPWMFEHCKQYIEWYHVAFKRERYFAHRSANKANLKFCKNLDFLERCIQVYQYFFCKERVVHNEVTYKLCCMVWIEVALQRRIDWHLYGVDMGVTLLPGGDIPRTHTYPNGGLGILHTATAPPPTYDTTDSIEDSDSDGANPPHLSTSPSAIRNRQTQARKTARDGLSEPDPNAASHGIMAERPPMASTSIARQLNFEGPRNEEHGVLEDASQVQPPPTATSIHVDPMEIVDATPNCPDTCPTIEISGDTEQVMAQNPPHPAPEIRKVGSEAIRLIQHLIGMVERSDALNKRNHNELNLLQRKVDEKDQLIVEKDAIIVEKNGAINTYRSTIATLTE